MQVIENLKEYEHHSGFEITQLCRPDHGRSGQCPARTLTKAPAKTLALCLTLGLISGLMACASPGDRQGAILSTTGERDAQDSVAVVNFNGYACDAQGLVRFDDLRFATDGKVLCRGAACKRLGPATRTVDAGGATLWPGLIDAHAHLRGLGSARQQLALNDLPSLDSVLVRLAEWARERPDDTWILGRGWNQMQWPAQKFPSAADLDSIVSDRPVVLERIDGHALWVNSKALALAGIDGATLAPSGGEILLNDKGEPTGILIDNADALVTRLIPAPDQQAVAEAFLLAIREANSRGLTGVHEAGISFDELQALHGIAEEGDLSLRINVMLSDNDDNLRRQGKPQRGLYAGRLSVDSVKIYADGALGSRGAALNKPYADRSETRGLLFLEQAALGARIRQANEMGFRVAVHAIGDRANEVALNAYADVQQGRPSPRRNRIEHAQVLAPEDIGRFAQLGVTASMQPTHATSDMWMAEQRLEPPRLAGAYAWQALRNAGARLAFGSDFPVEPVSPFYGLHAAVTRQDRKGRPPGGWRAHEAVSLETALCGFTRDAAYAGGDETVVGSLQPGHWADFILLAVDPFALAAEDLWAIEPLSTWIGGEQVYPREPDQSDH